MMLSLTEPSTTAALLLVFGLLIAFSVLFTRALDRLGVPVVLLFLLLGMLGGSEGIGRIRFEDYELAFRLGTIALVLILFDGGLNTAHSSIRRTIGPAGILATVGVAFTAGIVAVAARLFGLPWGESLLIGAIVSSTDAAAVFAVLRGGSIRVKEPVRSTLEVESCINDPMAIIVTMTIVEVIGSGTGPSTWNLVLVPIQLIIGGTIGVLMGFAARWVLNRVNLSTAGLYPVATLATAFLAFGLTTLAYGSGFLAVFAAGAVLGNGPLPYKAGLTRVHDSVAWFAQVSMFLMLGLLSFPSRLVDVAGIGLALGLVLAIVARPLAAAACVVPFRWRKAEILYTAWVGLRGAVPIVLATIPIMAGIPSAERVFDVVFFIVVVSTIIPGASIIPFTRRLGLVDEKPPPPSASIEMHSRARLSGDIRVYRLQPPATACGAALSELALPEHATVLLVVRGEELIPARGRTRLEAGDFVYVFRQPEDEAPIRVLFGRSLDE